MTSISAQPGMTDDQALLWKPEQIDSVSLFKARFNRFVYKKHRHQEFAIGIIEKGTQKFCPREFIPSVSQKGSKGNNVYCKKY